MMRLFSILLLTIIWLGFSNNFSLINIIFGLLISTVLNSLFFSREMDRMYTVRIHYLVLLILFVVKELIISSFLLARIILLQKREQYSHFIEIDVSTSAYLSRVILVSVISLTPGTLFIKFADDDKKIIIHSMIAKTADETIVFIKQQLLPIITRVFER